jgi:pSer/pThr/pTyr-binding forkhead associated (FHA) protein
VITGRAKGRTFQVSPDREHVVGRSGDCEVCIIDARISRRHCVISAGQSSYVIRDLGSANGVVLNDVKIDREAVLNDTDRVRLGTTELEFHLTERFEDAETKRLKPGEKAPPKLPPSRKKKSARKLDTEALVEFCSRCQGSIPAAEFTLGRAKKVDGLAVCPECLAQDRAVEDVAKVAASAETLPEPRAPGKPPRTATSAEEVSQLAAEVAQEAEAREGTGAGKAVESEDADEAVPVEVAEDQKDEFSTDALVFSEEERQQLADAEPEDQQKPGDSERRKRQAADTQREIRLPRSSAPTVMKTPEEIARLNQEAMEAAAKLREAELEPEAVEELEPEGIEEMIELDEDDLPQLPEEGSGNLDEDAKTPRPGSEIRVL